MHRAGRGDNWRDCVRAAACAACAGAPQPHSFTLTRPPPALLPGARPSAAPPAPQAPLQAIVLTDAALAHLQKMRAEVQAEGKAELLLRLGVKQVCLVGCARISVWCAV